MVAVLKEAPPIQMVRMRMFDVAPIVERIRANSQLWNQYTLRTQLYAGPHSQVSDIWCRYNAWENYDGDREAFNGPHESSWYPSADVLGIKPMIFDLMRYVGGTQLGGVLITKIPAHGECLPHVDNGWHARHYEKFAIQLAANARQRFDFPEDACHLVTGPGDLYTFDNSKVHGVINESDEDRMTMIVCIRRT